MHPAQDQIPDVSELLDYRLELSLRRPDHLEPVGHVILGHGNSVSGEAELVRDDQVRCGPVAPSSRLLLFDTLLLAIEERELAQQPELLGTISNAHTERHFGDS